jgi:hypothetical protein
MSPTDSIKIQDFADLFGFKAEHVIAAVEAQRYRTAKAQAYYSLPQLAARLQCSIPQVYKILRADNAKVINVGEGSKRKKLLVDAATVARFEKSRTENGDAMSTTLTIDSEFDSLSPAPNEQELAGLRESILREGCREPITVWKTEDDKRIIIDGHNRYRICLDLKKNLPIQNKKFASREEAKLWIFEHQFYPRNGHRVGCRNLTDDQRIMLYVSILNLRKQIIKTNRASQIKARHYETQVVAQKNLCAICKRPLGTRLCRDHRHSDGQLRGVLCDGCNLGIGFLREDPIIFDAAILYLRSWSTVLEARAS